MFSIDVQIDVDECKSNEHDCGSHEVCVNHIGGYKCHCNEGFEKQNEDSSCKKGAITFLFN